MSATTRDKMTKMVPMMVRAYRGTSPIIGTTTGA